MTVKVIRVTAVLLVTAITVSKGIHAIVSDAFFGSAKVMRAVQSRAV